MSILMVLIGATIGATIGSLFMHWRSDVAKERQQLESETPYDYALTNARADNERYRDELRTIQALKRTEADTDRIRNEIDTILPDGGEEATEDVYDPNIGMPIQDNGDGTFSPIFPQAGMSTEEASWDAGAVARAYARLGGNVREDGSEDERMSEDDVERSLINDIKEMASENVELAVEFAKMAVQDDEAIRKQLEETSKELAEEIVDVRRRMREFREEGKYYGETLYRKGSR